MKKHRYERIAAALSARIASGQLAVGDALPTEAALCAHYAVSRYTAREALRRLRDAGLITRRRRTGTTVAASKVQGAFNLPVNSAADLFQYATDTRLHIEDTAKVQARKEAALAPAGRQARMWTKLSGIRKRAGSARPVCLVAVYLHAALAGLEKRIPKVSGAIYPLVERALGVRISWITQKISAVQLAGRDANRLGVRSGTCGLRVRRYYYDANERLLEVSESLHPGQDFTYEMKLKRT